MHPQLIKRKSTLAFAINDTRLIAYVQSKRDVIGCSIHHHKLPRAPRIKQLHAGAVAPENSRQFSAFERLRKLDKRVSARSKYCLLYTSDAADE